MIEKFPIKLKEEEIMEKTKKLSILDKNFEKEMDNFIEKAKKIAEKIGKDNVELEVNMVIELKRKESLPKMNITLPY